MSATPRRSNRELAMRTLGELAARGVRTLVICPGARNSPWIEALLDVTAGFSFEVLHHFDERAAGFAALGRSRATTLPIAVLTTSGTAAGELLPAVMEAFYTGVPLYLLTADRPRRFRGTGAPQACEQVGIFGVYCVDGLDIDGEEDRAFTPELLPNSTSSGPVHWNVCFEDPRSEHPHPEHDSPAELSEARHPLVIVGELSREESRGVSATLHQWGYPVITEALSQLSEDPALEELRIGAHRGLLVEAAESGYQIDAVIRIGGVPTLRFWRDLESDPEASKIPVWSISPLPFRGLPRARALRMLLRDLYRLSSPAPRFAGTDSHRAWRATNRARMQRLEGLLAENPASEPGVFRTLSREIPADALVYLGNSLPIREWDLASARDSQFSTRTISASRGLNGIDGQLSTFFGMLGHGAAAASPTSESWAILGDLTTLYDSTAPWLLRELERSETKARNWHLAIINNSGGRIFERLFGKPAYLNAHELTFGDWARQWGLSHARIEAAVLQEFLARARSEGTLPQVLEIVPDPQATSKFWKSWEGA